MDAQLLMVVLVLPSLFGLSLVGDGVHRVMAYDNRGWIGISMGGLFIAVVIFAYLMISAAGTMQ